MFFVGWGIGAPLFGWLSDHIGLRRNPLFIGAGAQDRGARGPRLHSRVAFVRADRLCFLVGLFGSAQILCFALVKENHTPALSGTAIGFVNGVVTGAGALFQPLVGMLLDVAWTGESRPVRASTTPKPIAWLWPR